MRKSNIYLLHQSLRVFGLGGLMLSSFIGCTSDISNKDDDAPQELGKVSSAVNGAGVVNDDDFPERNAAVIVAGSTGSCSGVLLTPQLLLTANHCVWGGYGNNDCKATPNVGSAFIGPAWNSNNPQFAPRRNGAGAIVRGISYESELDACLPTDRVGQDVALIYLHEPVIESTIKTRIAQGRTAVAVPRLATLGPDDPTPPVHGLTWGTSGYGGGQGRRIKLFANGWIDTETDNGGSYFDLHIGSWTTEPGDSGGPLFVLNPDNTLRVIGVTSGDSHPFGSPSSITWANITASTSRAWLLAHAKEGNVHIDLQHSPQWRVRHGKTSEDWWGQLDYSGTCRLDVDRDCDGWFDQNVPPSMLHDNCFEVPNPGQEDTGDLGVGDACDPDRDRRTKIPERFSINAEPFEPDNCENAYNPDQANCNREYEIASRLRGSNVDILGDACDPVPCPKTDVITHPVSGWPIGSGCTDKPSTNRYISDEFVIRPVAPHVKTRTEPFKGSVPPGIAIPGTVPTKARYCNTVDEGETLVDCTKPSVRRNLELRDGISDSQTTTDPEHPWHRITLSEQRNGPSPGRNDNNGFAVTYADGASKTLFWNFRADDQHWHRPDPNGGADAGADAGADGGARLDVVGSGKPGDACSRTTQFGDGTCLDGWIWVHSTSTIGSSGATSDTQVPTTPPTPVGQHGFDLANYTFPITPDFAIPGLGCIPITVPCGPGTPGCIKELGDLWLSLAYCPNCSGVLSSIAADQIHMPIINPQGEAYGPVWASEVAVGQNIGLSGEVLQALTGAKFVSAIESTAPASGVAAVALPTTFGLPSQYLVVDTIGSEGFHVEYNQAGLGLRAARSTMSFTNTFDEPVVLDRVAPSIVYSRVTKGTFVIGGTDAQTGVHHGDVLFEPIGGAISTLTGNIEHEVLAATLTRPLSYQEYFVMKYGGLEPPESLLWTVERDGSGTTMLVLRNINPETVSAPLVEVPFASDSSDVFWLTGAWDHPDAVLLSMSNSAQSRWATFEVGHFSTCIEEYQGWDPSCVTFLPLLSGLDFPSDGYLIRGVRAEPQALVATVVHMNDELAELRVAAERKSRFRLAPGMPADPNSLYTWMQ